MTDEPVYQLSANTGLGTTAAKITQQDTVG